MILRALHLTIFPERPTFWSDEPIEVMDARVQAIDMGRRGLHNEAAELLTLRLEGRIAVDFETARRLFTLIAALHQRV